MAMVFPDAARQSRRPGDDQDWRQDPPPTRQGTITRLGNSPPPSLSAPSAPFALNDLRIARRRCRAQLEGCRCGAWLSAAARRAALLSRSAAGNPPARTSFFPLTTCHSGVMDVDGRGTLGSAGLSSECDGSTRFATKDGILAARLIHIPAMFPGPLRSWRPLR